MSFGKAIMVAGMALGWAIVSVASMTIGTHLDWPDYVHVNFGTPLTFATHTLSTIAGPADAWKIDIRMLTEDLVFWLGGMTVIVLVSLARLRD